MIDTNHVEAKVHKQVRHILVLLGDHHRKNAEDSLSQGGLFKLELLQDSPSGVFIQTLGVHSRAW
ncbi:MAG: hypothetical protein ACR65R_07170 [Methylomicrobium sp.]